MYFKSVILCVDPVNATSLFTYQLTFCCAPLQKETISDNNLLCVFVAMLQRLGH